MNHVIALDVSKGKSTITIYDSYKQCEFEGELYHPRVDFEQLHQKIKEITALDGQATEIFFEANLQMASMCRHKADVSDAYELATPNSALFLNFVQLCPHPALLKEHSKSH